MKKVQRPMFLIFAALVFVFSGCEWEGSGDSDSWNDSVSFVNFSGLYVPGSGQTYLISSFVEPASSPASLENGADTLGTGNSIDSTFGGTLSNFPVSLGSLSITDGTETFMDSEGQGQLTGNKGGIGSINYETGAVTVTFKLAPGAGNSIIATYLYFKEGTSENPEPGSSQSIFSMTVNQTGNILDFTDSNGASYSGEITGVTTPTGGGSNLLVSTTVIANFEVNGTSANGQAVTIAGAFYGDFTVGSSLEGISGISAGTLENRVMQGTWIEAGGTGSLYGQAGGTASINAANSNSSTSVNFWLW